MTKTMRRNRLIRLVLRTAAIENGQSQFLEEEVQAGEWRAAESRILSTLRILDQIERANEFAKNRFYRQYDRVRALESLREILRKRNE